MLKDIKSSVVFWCQQFKKCFTLHVFVVFVTMIMSLCILSHEQHFSHMLVIVIIVRCSRPVPYWLVMKCLFCCIVNITQLGCNWTVALAWSHWDESCIDI